jgi:glutamyl-tRNA reductase
LSVVVVGLEHRRTPLDVLERVTVAEEDLGKVLGCLRDLANLNESVVLSTCLRTEVYAVVDRFHEGVSQLHETLAGMASMPVEDLEEQFAVRFDDDVAIHLFSVAAGLESAVPGEGEVLGQVRRAWERARVEGTCGPVLGGLFRHAVETGKRVRTDTAIARGTTSFSHAALQLASELTPDRSLAGANVVVVGAGAMGSGLVTALVTGYHPASITVANRTPERAESAVSGLGDAEGPALRTVGLDGLAGALADADLVLTAVESHGHVLTPAHLAPRTRPGDLVVVDLGVPRNVDPAVGELPGVTLRNLDHLRRAVDAAMEGRRDEMDAAHGVVAEEVARYRAASRARVAAPVVAALRQRLEELRVAEVARRRPADTELSPAELAEWQRVDEVTRAALAKLLHEPTMLLKETAGTPRGERLVEALRILFDL